ncbi:hypothetical protein VNO77_26948 [Canavalia gladiata]|uniref:Bet v I/Major latex protein domain-containing protein n=1 Tax=Canavalia gladiata TaxID=3824 RepID=A0AAN9KTX2_CANGL
MLGDFYKSFKFILDVIPKKNGSEVHWIVEYEKQNHKDIDAYITNDRKSYGGHTGAVMMTDIAFISNVDESGFYLLEGA